MAKNLVSRPILAPLDQVWVPQIFFHEFYLYYMLDIVTSYDCMQFHGKLMNQTWGNGKKPSFESNFGPFDPNLNPQNFFISFTCTAC